MGGTGGVGKRLGRLFWVVCLALLLRACVLEPVRLTDDSMTPTLFEGDVALVYKLDYGLRVPGAGTMLVEWRTPQKGDLVVAVAVGDPPVSLLRRITAVPGDQVTLPEGEKRALKPNEYYLGAEQKDALDSRKLGPVLRRNIVGKATHVWAGKKSSSEGAMKVESPKSAWRVLQPL